MNPEISKKIKDSVTEAVPKGVAFRIYAVETGIDDKEVVRVVTPAWENLGKAERIGKIQKAVFSRLAEPERRNIFRFSVLTPIEWENMRIHTGIGKSRVLGYRSATTMRG